MSGIGGLFSSFFAWIATAWDRSAAWVTLLLRAARGTSQILMLATMPGLLAGAVGYRWAVSKSTSLLGGGQGIDGVGIAVTPEQVAQAAGPVLTQLARANCILPLAEFVTMCLALLVMAGACLTLKLTLAIIRDIAPTGG